MDAALNYYKRSWALVSKNLVGWVLMYTVLFVVSLMTCGLGSVLSPNAYREMKRCVDEDAAPELGGLFNLDNIATDAVNALIYVGAVMLGGMVGGVGGTIAGVVLSFMMPLAAENAHDPMTNAKLSLKHVGKHPETHIILVLIGSAISMPAIFLCLLPLPLVMPVIAMAGYLYYRDSRPEIDAIAGQLGRVTGPTS